jgi:hypothetical protein
MWFLTKRALSKAQQRWWYRLECVNERNLCWAEMDRERREWVEKVEIARRNHWPLPVGGGLIKARFEIAAGLNGRESGWDIDTIPIADFGNVNVTAAATIRAGLNAFPLVNPAHSVASAPDSLPYELSTLAALNASRASGTSTNFLAILVGVYIVHANIAAPPTAYAQAATTLNVKVLSTVNGTTTTTTAAPPTLATFSLAGATNLMDTPAITAPTERQVSTPTGTLLTTASGVYNGDAHFAEAVMTAAVNHQGTLLYVELEVM